MMDMSEAILECERTLNTFIQGRIHDVNNGTETTALAATLIIKYGSGMADALTVIYNNSSAGDCIIKLAEGKLRLIEPEWELKEKKRIFARPADLKLS